jgi:hypothetical protein
MPSLSSVAQTASAVALSFAEWLMKTSCAMGLSDRLQGRGIELAKLYQLTR